MVEVELEVELEEVEVVEVELEEVEVAEVEVVEVELEEVELVEVELVEVGGVEDEVVEVAVDGVLVLLRIYMSSLFGPPHISKASPLQGMLQPALPSGAGPPP